eukprot:m.124853 g.124853  ORF g.124853 m.124853 type:complete len:207 (-) comp23436_c0_seq3:34-654(-)
MMVFALLLLVSSVASLRYEVTGRVEIPEGCSDPTAFLQNTRVILNAGQFVAPLTRSGKFMFRDLPTASYLLEVQSPNYIYQPLRVDVPSENFDFRALKADFIGGGPTKKVELALQPIRPAQYFELRKGYNILELLMNPMILMMALPVVFIFLVPKMMEGLDKEELEKAQQNSIFNQKQQNQFDFSEYLSNMSSQSGAGQKRLKKGK